MHTFRLKKTFEKVFASVCIENSIKLNTYIYIYIYIFEIRVKYFDWYENGYLLGKQEYRYIFSVYEVTFVVRCYILLVETSFIFVLSYFKTTIYPLATVSLYFNSLKDFVVEIHVLKSNKF